MENRQVFLAARPVGVAQAEHFAIRSVAIPKLAAGEILVRNHYLSVEPAMRGWIADAGNYSAPVPVGEVMRSLASGVIVDSANPDFAVGQHVSGWFGWQEYAVVAGGALVQRVAASELRASLGILGINGVTALLALTKVGQPIVGETVLVSTAAGAVGSAVGQIARILGCRTVGITGSDEKVQECLDAFGYDAAINYRREDVGRQVAALCPDGVHVYFDNTSGKISDAVMPHLSDRARVVVCGTAAISSWDDWPSGPRVERHLLVKRARMEGFVVFDHIESYQSAIDKLREWIASGRLCWREDILQGLEACPDALAGLYRGENKGKRLIRLV